MANVLLIGPLTEQYSGVEDYGAPPLGVHRIASFLRAHGHNATVYDCNLQSADWLENTLRSPWDIIGVSIVAGTMRLSLEMFLRLREHQPEALLVAGGPDAMVNYQEIFENTDANAVVLGEGELPMLGLSEGYSPCAVKGLITRTWAVPVTNELLWDYYKDMDFSAMGWQEYWRRNETIGDEAAKNKLVRIVTASHCNRHCIFCSVSRLRELASGHRVKPAYLSGPRVRILIERILRQLPEVTHIYFIEDTFLPVPSRMDEFCDALAPFKDRVKFLVQTDTNRVDRDVISRLAEVGVIHISFGVENCSARIRTGMGKPQDDQKIEDIIVWCKEVGIRCYYLVILFAPDSTIEDLRVNYRTLSRWQTEGNVGISIMPYMIPYHGARIWHSDFEFAYKTEPLSNGKVIKQPYLVYPNDPEVRQIMERFAEQAPVYLDRFNREVGHGHKSKDYTGTVYIRLLGDLLGET